MSVVDARLASNQQEGVRFLYWVLDDCGIIVLWAGNSVWLECHLDTVEVTGPNPVRPTKETQNVVLQ